MKRIIYKVSYANSDDYQKGQYHFSPPFKKLSDAKKFEKKFSNMNARIEKWNEIYERNEWLPDWDMGNSWMEIIE